MSLAVAVKPRIFLKIFPPLLGTHRRWMKSVDGPVSDKAKEKANKRYWRFPKNRGETRQIFDFFLVLDFEATCLEHEKLKAQEVIEFPCIKVNAISMEPEAVFHQYVQPTTNPEISHFCTKLTGITQEMVEGQPSFAETLERFEAWMKEQGLLFTKNAFVTSGDWDLQFLLPHQCGNERIPVPAHFTSWVNIKQSFAEATGHYPRGITDMMARLNLKHTGRLHSGLDDCKNVTKILQKLAFDGHVFHKRGFSLPGRGPLAKELDKN